MAISNDWFVDYQNKLIVHATTTINYDGELAGGFTAGQTIGNLASPTKTAVVVKVLDNGTDGTLDVVFVVGSWADNDQLWVGASRRGDVAGTPTTKTTVYTTRALYSYIQDTFDELVQMDDTVPMSAQTPTEFTMINGWFMDDESTKFLSGGALATSGYLGEIQVVTSNSGGYVSCTNSSIGKTVVVGGVTNTGPLLHYNNTTRKWWVRYASTLTSGSVMTISGGTGGGTASADSLSGEDLYTNIYTLGTIMTNPNPKTYVFQNSNALSEWWGRGDGSAHIDVLIKVKESANPPTRDGLIDAGNVTVFVRQFGDSYDHFPITLASGGRQAVPLATSTDLSNNSTGEITIAYGSLLGGTFSVGQFVRDTTSGAYGEILADSGGNLLTIGNVIMGSGDFANGHALYQSVDGITDGAVHATSTGDPTAVVRGYSDIKIYFINLTLAYTSGGNTLPTVGATVTGASSGGIAKILSWTTTGGAWVSGTAAGIFTLANWNGTNFTNAEQLNQTNPTQTDLASAGAQTVAATTTKAFEQGSLYPYNVIVNCAGRTMAQVYEWFKYITREDANSSQINYQTMYRVNDAVTAVVQEDGEEYIRAFNDSNHSPVKASPFGTLAGGKLFAAPGVWVENMATADRQNFQLTDANGAVRNPPNFITITVSSVISGDKVSVFRTSGGTTINKTQFASGWGPGDTNNNSGAAVFYVGSSIPSDTPNAGSIRVVDSSDTSTLRESRYTYSSWTGSTFTLSGSTVLDRTYSAGEDTAYVPYYDEIAGNASVYVTVIYSADRTVLTRVRRYNGSTDSILPFQITGAISSTGYSVAAIRTPDTIVT